MGYIPIPEPNAVFRRIDDADSPGLGHMSTHAIVGAVNI